MKNFANALLILGVLVFSGTTFAGSIDITPANCDTSGGTPTPPDRTCWTSDVNNQPDAASLSALTGIPESDLNQLYKSDQGGSDSGPFADNYSTTYDNSPTDPQDALITWLQTSAIDCSEGCILAVKDGNHSPSLYVFDISDWNGMDKINMTNFWPGGGGISNVSIWGPSTQVPEPGTLALLGIGLFGLGILRRRKS